LLWSSCVPNLKCLSVPVPKTGKPMQNVDKNSSGDEIANVNFSTTISHTYFKIPKRELTYFV